VLGIAFGWVMAFVYTENQGLEQALIFITSFGMAHVPAAFILQLKHWRGGESDKDWGFIHKALINVNIHVTH
jgi:hypothetical protein